MYEFVEKALSLVQCFLATCPQRETEDNILIFVLLCGIASSIGSILPCHTPICDCGALVTYLAGLPISYLWFSNLLQHSHDLNYFQQHYKVPPKVRTGKKK